ncbi:VanW family protein [Clostridium sp.]|jgi:vancomycin resistance protein YoaR|uniref:VanW family protein n=1 Tax=Clostridium sp. TaxID=1506 RepID=UPI00258E2757|nr:VanW family protein [Clostridium sp.]MDF2503699.1 putative vancomycin resistance protein [Clostridium sp.]
MKKKNIIIIGVVCAIIVILGISIPAYNIYSKVKSFDNIIYPGVKIGNIDVSGKTVVEAKKMVSDKYQAVVGDKKVNVQARDKNYSITYSKLDAQYNTDKVVKEAFDYGKNLGTYGKYNIIKKPVKKDYKLAFTYNKKPLDDFVDTIKKDVNKDPVNAIITKSGSGFQVSSDSDGFKLKDEELKNKITGAIDGTVGSDTNVQADVETVKASKTKDKLQSVNTLISTFSTEFGSRSSAGRVVNIQLATKAISGLCLMPGESFSFNGVVGERTAAKGYQSAPVDIGYSTGMGLGGGICQVSTTLYNAVLQSGIKSTERLHHTIPSAYVPLGFDATVDYGNLDYQFKNTLDFPIYIEGSSNNGTETFNIYSNNSLTNKTYKVVNDVYQEIKPSVSYINDSTLPAGTTRIDQNPSTGHKVKVFLQTFQNGTMVSQEMIANDTYNAVNQVIRRGTKK